RPPYRASSRRATCRTSRFDRRGRRPAAAAWPRSRPSATPRPRRAARGVIMTPMSTSENRRRDQMAVPVTVYSNVGRGPCHKAMEYLSQMGIQFTERNVGKDPKAREELMALGLLSLPVIIIGDKRLTGFNPKAIDAALSAS